MYGVDSRPQTKLLMSSLVKQFLFHILQIKGYSIENYLVFVCGDKNGLVSFFSFTVQSLLLAVCVCVYASVNTCTRILCGLAVLVNMKPPAHSCYL